jgi:hypothetical protein
VVQFHEIQDETNARDGVTSAVSTHCPSSGSFPPAKSGDESSFVNITQLWCRDGPLGGKALMQEYNHIVSMTQCCTHII